VEDVVKDQAETLREIMRSTGVQTSECTGKLVPAPVDKAKLWDGLEADLERWTLAGGFDKPNLSDEALAEFHEMMMRRREQS
jgi:hypothetical protein